jgi:hypothetical protein
MVGFHEVGRPHSSSQPTVSTVPGLIEKICVARDEAVGGQCPSHTATGDTDIGEVYGFIFFKGDSWVDVIIDE